MISKPNSSAVVASLICLAIVQFAGCGKQSASTLTAAYNTNDLAEFLQPGVTREQVIEKYGKPIDTFDLEGGRICLTYDVYVSGRLKPGEVVGFQAVWRSNRFETWSAVLSSHDAQ